jgi:hypothetical protein
LYYKLEQEAEVIDYYSEKKKQAEDIEAIVKAETAQSWLRMNDMTLESVEKYEILSRRAPFTFNMTTAKANATKSTENVCKLPVIFFWLRKPFTFTRQKNTG